MATVLVTNHQKRTWFIPAAPAVGAEPIPVGPGEFVPVPSEHWEYVVDGGKNEAVQALLLGRHITVVDAEKYQAPEHELALRNPASPVSPPELRDDSTADDDRVTKTTTRATKAPTVTPAAAKKEKAK